MEITVSAKRYRRWLAFLILALVAVSFAGNLGVLFLHMRPRGFLRVINVDMESSIPTWYSSVNLAVSAALLAAIAAALRARKETKDLLAWLGLAVVFASLSLDEIAGFHESVGNIIRETIPTSGYLRFAWVLPAFVLLPLFGAAYLGFLGRLPARRRNQFVAAGLVFVGGAVVVEMIGAKLYVAAGDQLTLPFVCCIHLEEFLEMFGIVLFNGALIEHLAGLLGKDGLRLRFSNDDV